MFKDYSNTGAMECKFIYIHVHAKNIRKKRLSLLLFAQNHECKRGKSSLLFMRKGYKITILRKRKAFSTDVKRKLEIRLIVTLYSTGGKLLGYNRNIHKNAFGKWLHPRADKLYSLRFSNDFYMDIFADI